MVRRILQALTLLGLVWAASADTGAARGCRDICFYSQGLCEGGGDTWEFDCSGIDPDYEGDCDLDSYCNHT
jgi:hypothetical protein